MYITLATAPLESSERRIAATFAAARTMVCVEEIAKRASGISQTLTDFVGVALRI